MKTTPIQIDKELHSSFKKFCKENGYIMQGLVEKFIKSQLDGKKKENKS